MTMTKAKFMIVTPTNPKKSSLMIVNNIVSTIAPPPLSISQQIAVEQVCIHQRVKVATNSTYSHFPYLTLYNIFLLKTSEHITFSSIFCFYFFFYPKITTPTKNKKSIETLISQHLYFLIEGIVRID